MLIYNSRVLVFDMYIKIPVRVWEFFFYPKKGISFDAITFLVSLFLLNTLIKPEK